MTYKKISKDVIIIGAGISGLVAAHTSSELGFDTLVIEKNDVIGGANISKITKKGKIFDHGYHALDFNRSKMTTKFFKEMLDSKYYKIKLKRGIVLKNDLITYNSPLKQWPSDLKELFDLKSNFDSIKNNVTKNKIKKTYGEKFTNFIFSDILQSYPTIKWAIKNNAKNENIIEMVYPWFFPKLKKNIAETESGNFHDRMRNYSKHYILYPKRNGFGEFINGIQRKINKKRCKIIKNAKNIKFIFDSKNNLKKIIIKNKEYNAKKYFWCTSPIILLKCMKKDEIKINKKINQTLLIGNCTFSNPIQIDLHEILVGSIEHKINRISFPGNIQQRENLQIQIEFLITKDDIDTSETQWMKLWLSSLEKIGIITSKNKICEFELKKEEKGFATTEKYETIRKEYEKKFEKILKNSNVTLPYLNLGPENLNRVIPGTKLNVMNSLRTIKGINV